MHHSVYYSAAHSSVLTGTRNKICIQMHCSCVLKEYQHYSNPFRTRRVHSGEVARNPEQEWIWIVKLQLCMGLQLQLQVLHYK